MNKMNWTDERFTKEILDYKYLIENFKTADVTDRNLYDRSRRNFQRICTDYFHNALIARKYADINVLEKHYELLESYKDSDTTPDFESALRNLFEKTGLVIPLLASQVAHFFNPDLPIYSGSVLKGLNIDDTTARGVKDPESKINETCKVYNALTDAIHEFRDSDTGQEIIAGFKSVFNQHPRIIQNITDTKIIDFYFWLPTLGEEKRKIHKR